MALSRFAVDERMRIVGAKGKRPILRNVSRDAVEHFRNSVEIADLTGETSVSQILDATKNCVSRNPGPVEPFAGTRSVATIAGYVPQRMVSDPAGYFVVFPDRGRRLLTLEHYRNDGVLDIVIEGHTPAELYVPAVERNLISCLDHAAYLGTELARAEQAMLNGGSYIQDAAPDRKRIFSHVLSLRLRLKTNHEKTSHHCRPDNLRCDDRCFADSDQLRTARKNVTGCRIIENQ